MSKIKPDWAERIQRSRQRSYDAGYDAAIADKETELLAVYRLGKYMQTQYILKVLKDNYACNLQHDKTECAFCNIIALVEESNKAIDKTIDDL